MVERITMADLNREVAAINDVSRRKYKIGAAYGGVKLEVLIPGSSGIKEITYYRLTKRELFFVLLGIRKYVEEEHKYLDR